MGERIPCRSETDNQYIFPVIGQRVRPFCVQRIPSGEQTVDLKTVRQIKNVSQDRGLGKRYIHRVLLLKDTALHAVVTDTMACSGTHGIVDGNQSQSTD